MKLYKLTDANGCTKNNTQWGENVTHRAQGYGAGTGDLCSDRYIHAYEHPLLAVLMNPIHANFDRPRLWEAEGEVVTRDGQLKCGCVELTTIREIPVPVMTTDQRVEFAIRCALAVYNETSFVAWANKWLDGADRSAARAAWAAGAAARAAEAAAWAAEAARAAAGGGMGGSGYRSVRHCRDGMRHMNFVVGEGG